MPTEGRSTKLFQSRQNAGHKLERFVERANTEHKIRIVQEVRNNSIDFPEATRRRRAD